MSKRLSKEEQRYQLGKPYGFRDLELSLKVKIDECELLKKEVSRLKEDNASLRYDINRFEKVLNEYAENSHA